MGTYYWAASNRPALGSMFSTTTLNDGSAGNTTTGESGADTESGWGGGCPAPLLIANGYLTLLYDAESNHDFSNPRFTFRGTISSGGIGSECGADPGDPPLVQVISWELERSISGESWTPIASGSEDADNAFKNEIRADTFTARYLRLVLLCHLEKPRINTGDWTATARCTDFRFTATPNAGNACGLPLADRNLTRGTTAHFTNDGTTGPTIDQWEIYRCISSLLTLVDSGDLGHAGLAGYLVAASNQPGKNYSIYAPPSAVIAADYEARIDDSGDHSINFNVIAPAGAGATLMAVERPSVFEEFRHGFQPSGDQAVQANRKLKHARMGIPDPQQQSSHAMEQGGDGTIDLIPYKEWTDIVITVAELSYQEKIELLYMLFGEPYIKAVPGASTAKDVIWMVSTDRLEAAARVTVEQGQEDYPSRIRAVELMSGTFTIGKQNNSAEFNGIGRKLDEELSSFSVASPTEPSYVPIVAARNNHYLGTAYSTAGTASVGCDVHNASITFPQRRQALFTQCEEGGETSGSWKDTVRVAAPPAITLEMSQTVRSRALSRDIRNKTKYFYKYFNRSTVDIEAGFPYEDEFAAPVKLDDRGGADTDAVATGVHNLIPVKDSSFDPMGIGTPGIAMFRVRAPWTVKPTSTNI